MSDGVVLAMALGLIGLMAPVPGTAATEAQISRDRLHIAFDESMEVWGNQGVPGLRLVPALPLECRWDSDTDLTCDFPEGNKARSATRYRIHVPALRTQDGRALTAQILSVETDRPELHASAYSVAWDRGLPKIRIGANQQVDAAAASAVLRLSIDGRSVPVVLLPEKDQPWMPAGFILELPQIESWRGMLELSVVPGLTGDEGPLAGTQDAVLLRALLDEEPRVAQVACSPAGQVDISAASAAKIACLPGVVRLTFNRELDEASRARFARQLPAGVEVIGWMAANLTDWRDGRNTVVLPPGQSVRLRIDAPRTRSQVEVAPGLRSVDGRAVAVATVTIDTGDHPPALRAPDAAVLLADPAAPLPITAVNAPAGLLLKVDALARSSASASIGIPVGSANIDMPLDDPATRQALSEGGLVRWTLPATGTRWDQRAQTLHIAAPQLDVLALAASDDVLVWINDWDTGEGVSGANAELMVGRTGADPVTIATARTDADGIARIRLPDAYLLDRDALAESEWFVRASAGRWRQVRRAVLPLGTADRTALANPGTDRAWGVTDRPLYRAGDKVRFRLWQRADRAGRLTLPAAVTGPAKLHLVSADEFKVIRSWTSTSSTGDGWSGEVELPVHANDGTYCISPSDEPDEEGACFFVGTYRAQDLWVEASARERVLREGDRFVVDLSGGYYSGGPAAGVGVSRVATMLTGLPLSQAYPDFSDFTFIDVMGAEARHGIPLRKVTPPATTDAEGRVQIELPIAFDADGLQYAHLPAFARLQVTAEFALESREGTVSNAAAARFTRHDAFVGLRLEPRWLDATSPVQAEAVVIDAEGNGVPGRTVDVEVDFLESYGGDAVPQRVGSCQLHSRKLQACDFPRTRSGRYRLTARSGDAAPTELMQYVWSGDRADAPALKPVLEVADMPGTPGGPVRVVLRQVAVGKPVLFVLSQKGRILAHVPARTESTVGTFDLPLPADIEGEVDVAAYVRDPAGGPQDGALRTPVPVETAEVSFEMPTAKRVPVEIAFEQARIAPGERTSLTVRNASAQPRRVTISVMGDALRALAGDLLEYSDPHGPYWLGKSRWYGNVGALSLNSFGGWNEGSAWSVPLSGAVEEPPVVFDSLISVAPPAPPAPAFIGESTILDRIQVTGSRIALADVFSAGKGRVDGPTERAQTGAAGLIARLARVRGAFADTALWVGDIRLAPGESRAIEVTLPDNLTRWRAIAWSADDGDDFSMVEATIESGLPVEARLQAPVRMYPGDRARLIGNARQTANGATTVEVALQATGAGTDVEVARTVDLPARGQIPFPLEIAPQVPGTVEAVAAARTADGSDGVGTRIEIAPATIEGHRVQAGWLTREGVKLDVPALPAGASNPHLQVELLRGGAGLLDRWTHDLRDYSHRCWEQILSRGVGAALAITRGDESWPDAEAAVNEALDNTAVFQDEEGGFHYFADTSGATQWGGEPRREVALTAYSLRALELLRGLGYTVPERVIDSGRGFLAQSSLGSAPSENAYAEAAFASGVVDGTQRTRDALWQHWESLALPARIAATRGMVLADDPHAAEAYRLLLADAPRRGARRVVTVRGDWSRWMGSAMREQCALIDLLQDVPGLQAERSELIAGLADLYAGGVESTDTQSGAICLIALRDLAAGQGLPIEADLQAGATSTRLQVAPDSDRTRWEAPARGIEQLRLAPVAPAAASSYVVELRYQEDARRAQSSAVGMDIARSYEVLRDGGWMLVEEAPLTEGDWVRITLTVSTSATRHFVAVTDAVPGGLQPTDLRLSGVGGLDLQALSGTGSFWFATRRLDPRSPKFYAERLPAGRHEVHYFARVGNAGDYLAAPATAELMYGNASRARTAAARLRIGGGPEVEE